MYRDFTEKLNAWKDDQRRKPLIVTGVRQSGKTYTIKEFGRANFSSFVYINFEGSENVGSVFDYDYDIKRIISELEIISKTKIIPGETLLFFDEIQECPRAITSLKYFCEEMRQLHVICAGSLLGVALKQQNVSFPVGKINRLRLYPMSFSEFVRACGREDLLKVLNKWPVDKAIPDLYTVPMKKLLKEYYIVGGMPESVQTWVNDYDFDEVTEVQNEILNDYADDFSKHAPIAEIPKIRWIWDSVPVQLAKENNKFIFSHVKAGKRSYELENAMQWLTDAGLISQVYLVEEPELPLAGFANKTYFKVYMSDIGLLRAKARISPETILNETDTYIRFKGAFAENYVFNELIASDNEPYFWRSDNTAEIDFIIEYKDNVIPIEVKSADNTQAKSYKEYCRKYKPHIGLKLSEKNIANNDFEGTGTFSIPLYMIWCMGDYYK